MQPYSIKTKIVLEKIIERIVLKNVMQLYSTKIILFIFLKWTKKNIFLILEQRKYNK